MYASHLTTRCSWPAAEQTGSLCSTTFCSASEPGLWSIPFLMLSFPLFRLSVLFSMLSIIFFMLSVLFLTLSFLFAMLSGNVSYVCQVVDSLFHVVCTVVMLSFLLIVGLVFCVVSCVNVVHPFHTSFRTLSKTKLPCPLFSLCLLHDGTTMVGGGGDGKLHVYDLRNCSSPKDTIPAHTSPVYCLVLPRSSSARRRRSSKSAKSNSTPSLHSRESSVVAPPPPTAHLTPQTTVNSNTTATHSLDKESPSIGRLAGGGDSIFSPLMQGAPSMSESRISDVMHDNTLGKAHSLPQRLSGSGSEHKAPSYPPKKLEEVTKEESVQSSFHVPVPHQFPSSSPFGRNYGEVGSLPGRANFHSTAVHVDTTPSAVMR